MESMGRDTLALRILRWLPENGFHRAAVVGLTLVVLGLYGAALVVPGGPADERFELALLKGQAYARTVSPGDAKGWALGGVRQVAITEINTVRGLSRLHEAIGYRWASVLSGAAPVPRIFLAALPSDLNRVRSVERRKQLFFKTMLPLVVMVNDVIVAKRQRILEIRNDQANGKQLSSRDADWLAALYARFGVEAGDIDALLERVDIVSPSLALAQAAKESGWGTSRFAQEGNAIFGQRTWGGEGIVPEDRPEDGTFKVRAFDSLLDSVWSYTHNLNSHDAYANLRRERAAMRAAGAPIDGDRLAGTLTRYSEIGTAYIDALRTIIRVNKLDNLDRRPLQLVAPDTLA